jgi:hypothetical protein
MFHADGGILEDDPAVALDVRLQGAGGEVLGRLQELIAIDRRHLATISGKCGDVSGVPPLLKLYVLNTCTT